MAGPLTRPPTTGNGAPPPTLNVPGPRAARGGRRYVARFGLGYLVLLAALAGAGFGAWWLLERGNGKQTPAELAAEGAGWADFAPTQAGLLGAQEIAFHVQRQFRLPSGKEPVVVLAHRPSIQASSSRVPIEAAVISPESARKDKDYAVVSVSDDLQYTLCGDGPNCSISEGRPSAGRARWLRREAIELALYSFHYDADVNRVIVFLPGSAPPAQPKLDLAPLQRQLAAAAAGRDAGATLLTLVVQVQDILLQMLQSSQATTQQPSYAMLFDRQQLQGELSKPLDQTLPQQDRYSVEDAMDPDLAEMLDDIAEPSFFTYDIQQGGDGTAILFLTPQHL